MVDISTLERFAGISNYLLDLDSQNSVQTQYLQENIKSVLKTKRVLKVFRLQLLSFERTIAKEKAFMDEGFFACVQSLKKIQENLLPEGFFESPNLNEKIQKILKNLVPFETILKFEKIPNFNQTVCLLENFHACVPGEEPETEISESENKKIAQHAGNLTKVLEKVAGDLLRLLNLSAGKKIEESKLEKMISPNELKVLKFKINRLHNRGSLTDDEARDMLGKINVLPVSPNHAQSKKKYFPGNLDFSVDIIADENPVTETREKIDKLGSSFTKELNKKLKFIKSGPKRSITPAKKAIRNTSLPKSISVTKYKSKDKIKPMKLKGKSPHSFM